MFPGFKCGKGRFTILGDHETQQNSTINSRPFVTSYIKLLSCNVTLKDVYTYIYIYDMLCYRYLHIFLEVKLVPYKVGKNLCLL